MLLIGLCMPLDNNAIEHALCCPVTRSLTRFGCGNRLGQRWQMASSLSTARYGSGD